MLRLVFALCLLLSLSACQQPKTYHYLIRHPQQLRPIVDKCNQMVPEQARSSKECQLAARVAIFVNQTLRSLQTNPEQVGQEIMQAQVKYVHLQEKLAALQAKANNGSNNQQAEMTKLKQQIQAQRDAIDGRRAVLRMVEGNIG